MAAGNGGQKMNQYSWFTVYEIGKRNLGTLEFPQNYPLR